ncbi:type II toxin-antitoxin system prevent-host-death family antitoxin [Pseudactinotalea sp. HY160]|uniref:type II toxin-antitoxin system Phd/YefM family antitoxin n=1 Tax=Pseudactinotalea sp. HY160 TaxID=2654490 RepID=UPI00128C9E6A|nr:type II toxin-antitoxin system prevent-host-death family antitoxin [Pseudactinotalea sp. HY160]MPV50980.1 type II toxin-antitoxin system prevent-host-death family antitoxin [Pseudactinotalea sp. HY160]
MEIVNVQAAKTHLSRLITRAQRGEEITVARSGHPVVRLTPIDPVGERTFDTLPIDLPDSFFFDELPEEELAAWE